MYNKTFFKKIITFLRHEKNNENADKTNLFRHYVNFDINTLNMKEHFSYSHRKVFWSTVQAKI